MQTYCAGCDCRLAASCCGDDDPYEMDGALFCCRSCAEDDDCTCGCQSRGAPAEPAAGGSVGPVF